MFWPIFTVVVCVFLFIGTFLLNKKIKIDESLENDLPENCLNCQNQTCKMNLKKNKDNNIIDDCNKGDNNE